MLELAAEARASLELLEQSGDAMAQLEAAEAAAAERAARSRATCTPPASRPPRGLPARWSRSSPTSAWTVRGSWWSYRGAAGGARGDRCELLLAANTGLDPAPLASTASGGELSRIALAIRVAARAHGGPETLVLDEVDAGVGGLTARAVGEKLVRLAEHAQVISITHLPQIASLADAHFRVEKLAGDPTQTTVNGCGARRSPRSSRACWAAMMMTKPSAATPRRCRKSPQRA